MDLQFNVVFFSRQYPNKLDTCVMHSVFRFEKCTLLTIFYSSDNFLEIFWYRSLFNLQIYLMTSFNCYFPSPVNGTKNNNKI